MLQFRGMAYQAIVDAVREAATAVNENGTFVHGRKADGSLEYDGAFPQIHLYPFELSVDIANSFVSTGTLLLGFWQQDAPDSTNEKREEIIADMEALAKAFLISLDDNANGQITGIKMQPQYQTMAATMSGYAISFTINFAETKC